MAGYGGWQAAVLQGLKAPVSPSNIKLLNAWQRAEGGAAAYNPLNTTQGPGVSSYNSVGVKNYASPQAGTQATIQTLMNGRYGPIIQGLRQNANPLSIADAVGSSPWGTSGSLIRSVLGGPVSNQVTPGGGGAPAQPSLNKAAYETAGTLRARGSTPVQTNPFMYSNFATRLIDSIQGGQMSTEGMLGAIMQLRQDLNKQSSVANQHSGASAPDFSTMPQVPSQGTSIKPGAGVVQKGVEHGMQISFANRLNQLIKEVGNLSITSGYRSPEEQTTLWNNAVKKYGSAAAAQKWVAPPGHSNHNKGLAADLGGNLQAAHKLAGKYGLTFPMPWEPWHIEPIGIR